MRLRKKEKQKLSDSPIRKCSEDCYLFKNGGQGCRFYQEGLVKFGETCQLDLQKLKEYSDAFLNADNRVIKEDAAKINASIVMLINRMLEQVTQEGVTVQEPILDAKGNPIMIPDPKWNPADHPPGARPPLTPALRIKDHPLISRAIQLAKSLGINLNEFKLTPKSAEEKRQVSGHILVENPESLEKLLKQREKVEEKFKEALEKGAEMTLNDPVYKELMEDGDIIE